MAMVTIPRQNYSASFRIPLFHSNKIRININVIPKYKLAYKNSTVPLTFSGCKFFY